jgi:hypothetical protein
MQELVKSSYKKFKRCRSRGNSETSKRANGKLKTLCKPGIYMRMSAEEGGSAVMHEDAKQECF